MAAPAGSETDTVLQVYLQGAVGFDAALAFQRRQVYQTSSAPSVASLLLCEHPPLITVGREGSRAHILYEPAELQARQWHIRWVNRGGGCILHLPGQLAIYSVLALNMQSRLPQYLQRLQVLCPPRRFGILAGMQTERAGVFVGRPAHCHGRRRRPRLARLLRAPC